MHPSVLELVDLLADFVADESEHRPDSLADFRDVDRLPEHLLAFMEARDRLVDRLDTETLETRPEWLTGVQPERWQGHDHGIGEPVRGLDHSHPASVMLGWLRSAGLPLSPGRRVESSGRPSGGPFFARRDNGWWSIGKGIVEADESDEEAAAREFEEETGWPALPQPWIELGETTLKSRKIVVAFAVEADLDPDTLASNMITISGRSFPRSIGSLDERPPGEGETQPGPNGVHRPADLRLG